MSRTTMDAAVLLVRESVKSGRPDLLMFYMASVAARVLLASEGYDMAKVLAHAGLLDGDGR